MLNPRDIAFFCTLSLFLAGIFYPSAAIAQSLQPEFTVAINEDFDSIELGRGLGIFVSDGSLRRQPLDVLTESEWTESEQDSLSFGFSPAPRWIRFGVRNDTPIMKDLLLEISNGYLDYVDVYQISDQGLIFSHSVLGDQHPASERPITHANFLAPLSVAPGEQATILMRVETNSTNRIPITLWDHQQFISADFYRTLFQATLYGIFIAISAYYLLLFMYLKELAYFYWSLAILGVLFIVLSLNGTATALVWPGNTRLSDVLIMLGICGTCGAAALFSKEVLDLRERPALSLSMNALLGTAVLLFAISFVAPYQTVLKLGLVMALINALFQVTVYVVRLFDGFEPARYTVIAAVFICLGVIINILSVSGRLPSSFLGVNAVGIGATFAVLFYSLALSNRMNLDRALRESAQMKLASDLDLKVKERSEALEKANEQLRVASITDGLTGLMNRRHFDEVFEKEFRSAYRLKQPIAVLMIDVDHFKKLNDNYGHPFGDLCLKSLADMMMSCLNRPTDICARYGGEEFILALPGVSLEGAVSVGETIRKKVAETVVKDGGDSVRMTLSIGVACAFPEEPDQHELLIRRADACLYRAKQQGRNRVESE